MTTKIVKVILLFVGAWIIYDVLFAFIVDPFIVPLTGARPVMSVITAALFLLPAAKLSEHILKSPHSSNTRKEFSSKNKLIRIALSTILGIGILFLVFATQYFPAKQQWDTCQKQLVDGVSRNNAQLQATRADIKEQCAAHKETYNQSKICFNNVKTYNMLTKLLLADRQIKSLDEMRSENHTYCSQYPELVIP